MPVILVGQLFLEAILLGLLVRWIAPHNATADLFNMVVVIGGALIGGLLINWGLAEGIGPWTLVLQAALLVGLLIMAAGTNLVQAGIVTVLFFAAKVPCCWRGARCSVPADDERRSRNVFVCRWIA